MKIALVCAVPVILAAVGGGVAALAEAEPKEQAQFYATMKRADAELNLAHFLEAKKLYEDALAEGKRTGVKRPDLAVVLSDIAMIAKLNFQYEEAQNCLFDALPMAGDDESLAALLHTRLSSVLRARGNLEGALEHAKTSVEIRRKLDPKSPLVAESLNNVAVLALDSRNSKEAIDYCDQSLALLRERGKAGSAEEAAVMSTKAAALIEERKFDAAIELLTQAVSNQEKAFGADSPKLAITLNNLAMAISKTGRYQESVPYLKRALKLTEASKPQDIAGAADAGANLAVVYAHLGEKVQAEACFKKAIEYGQSINYRNLADIKDQYQRFLAGETGPDKPSP
ncbi:MAG: tetratricopeptide repeat protein [Cyanobacteria bacterium SZAS TMP-1]|nr:tetratricopeptide repeat protein [Cyanobacteria bacterium SZAS TMP-1]